MVRSPKSIRENLMSDDSYSDRASYGGANFRASSPNNHEDSNRARRAAEALFVRKEPIGDPISSNATGSAQQSTRKPRILSAVREQQPAIQATDLDAIKRPSSARHEKPRKRVPASHLGRIRTWLKYGMPVDQAADMYGVNVSEIERILQKA